MGPTYLTNTGGFPLGHHLEMLMDAPRLASIRQAIDVHASPAKNFIEIGVGSGIFLEHARHLFLHATGIEQDAAILEVARSTMSSPGPNNWTLKHGDAREIDLGQKYDVLLCELLSTWCIIEHQVSAMRAAHKMHLAPSAVVIPSKVINLIELGYTPFGVGPARIATPFLALTGIRAPTIMSLSSVAHALDFTSGGDLPEGKAGTVSVEPLVSGTANCVRLTSIVELTPGINWYSSDTLMPPMVYPLRDPIQIHAGSPIDICYDCRFGCEIERTSFWGTR